jgi:spore coat protein A
VQSPRLRKFVDPLPRLRPQLPPEAKRDGSPLYDIPMRLVRQKLHRDLPATPLWAYAGQFPGPTIEVRRGQRIFVRWRNELPGTEFLIPGVFDTHLHGTHHGESRTKTVTHLHGAVAAADSDGHPDAWFTSGFRQRGVRWTTETYEYPNEQAACMLWYHDHAIGQTRLNVYAGLAGAHIIRDREEDALALPRGDYEIPLLLQDRSFAADGSLAYAVSQLARSADHPGPWVPEFFGDTNLVNGKVWPYLDVERRPYRFRILNASNGRFYRLRLSDGQPFVQIATDQGLMAAPVELDTLLLAPAERADVIVDFGRARAGTIRLTNDAAAPYPGGEHPERDTVGEVMEFRVARRTPRSRPAAIPGRLGTLTPLPQSGAIVRYTALREYQNSRGEPIIILIDSRRWDGPVTIRPRLGDTEIWHFINTTDDSHPIHLHLVRFQVLDHQPFDVNAYLAAWGAEKPGEGPDPIPVEPYLQGERKPPSAQDRGWKDTVQVDPHEVVRIIARFDGYTGRYPWHCHMLEHEDNEMMLQFEVVAPAGT